MDNAARPPPDADPGRARDVRIPEGPFDVVVVGAGAAGLWAAGTAGARGRRVLLLEKNRRVGVKILASGGGACNLTTTLGPREAAAAFRSAGERFLGPAFRALSPQALRDAFGRMGVPTHVEEALEKVWPDSRKARDVVDALVRRAVSAGVVITTSVPVVALRRAERAITVHTPAGDVTVPRVVVTVGGRSYPKTGTMGDGYPWLEALGHTITPLAPALVPLVVEEAWVRELAGIALLVRARALAADGSVLGERERPLLFTHTGLSGPAAMDVSRWFSLAAPWRAPRLSLDLRPDVPLEEARRALEASLAAAPSGPLERALPAEVPERLRRALVRAAGGDPGRRGGEAPRALRHAITGVLKGLVVPVAGTRGYDFAEVTAGGVDLTEVDPGTMASRVVPGLHLAGEILDLDGPIGGFNFQSAFATGEMAGRAV